MGLSPGDIRWAQVSIKTPVYELPRKMPSNPENCNATIDALLQEIEIGVPRNMGHGRPCIILPREAKDKVSMHASGQVISLCVLATFHGLAHDCLPIILRETIVPVNGLSKKCPHHPVFTTAWKCCPQSDTDWIICIRVSTAVARVGNKWTKGGLGIRVDDYNMKILLNNIADLPSNVVSQASSSKDGKFKRLRFNNFRSWSKDSYDKLSAKGSFASRASDSTRRSATIRSRVTSQASSKSAFSFHSPQRPSPLRQDHSAKTTTTEPLTPTNGSFGQRIGEALDKVGGAATREGKCHAFR